MHFVKSQTAEYNKTKNKLAILTCTFSSHLQSRNVCSSSLLTSSLFLNTLTVNKAIEQPVYLLAQHWVQIERREKKGKRERKKKKKLWRHFIQRISIEEFVLFVRCMICELLNPEHICCLLAICQHVVRTLSTSIINSCQLAFPPLALLSPLPLLSVIAICVVVWK